MHFPLVQIVSATPHPVALNLSAAADALSGARRYVTIDVCAIRFGPHELVIGKGFTFDGPSIPRILWWIAGLSPCDLDTVLAALVHDWVCEHPDELPRIVGDAIFFHLLGPIMFNGRRLPGVGPWRRRAMYLAVRLYSFFARKETL